MPETVIGVLGTGRLGRAVRDLATAEGHSVRCYDPRDPGGWRALPLPGVLVDCSAPALTGEVAALCRELRLPLVECVSGQDAAQLEELAALGTRTAVVLAHNLSLGNYLQTRALRCVAGILAAMRGAGVRGAVPEAAVLERHPVSKAHRPSATARALAREWTRGTGGTVSDVASLRAGPAVSDHEIRLAWPEQALTVSHAVHSLDAAAAGAIGVALWAADRAPGTYPVHEVFDDMVAAMTAMTAKGGGPGERAAAHATTGERP
jgi:4-hydroxy-tetrahydrodipicolinate reductase